MKQKIKLTEENKKILIEVYGMRPEEFMISYWQKIVVNSEYEMNLVFNKKSTTDIPTRIKSRAGKLMKKRIQTILGLPSKGGSIAKQRRWHKVFDKSGLQR